jgi:hypothetical protein
MAARLQTNTSTIGRMSPRYFTLEQANEAVAELLPVVEEMVEHHGRFLAAQGRRAELTEQAGANGGDLTPSDFAEVERELEAEAAGLARCVEEIQSAGALVKDLDRGLLDFPALRDGQEILLCWHLGEDEIEYFHGIDEGFAGRKPL